MFTIKANKTTRLYKHPEYDANDPGHVVPTGYLLLADKVQSEHRFNILKILLIDGTTVCVFEKDWDRIAAEDLYCPPKKISPSEASKSAVKKRITYRASRPTKIRVNASTDSGASNVEFGEMIKVVDVLYEDGSGIVDARLVHKGAEYIGYIYLPDFQRLEVDGTWVDVK